MTGTANRRTKIFISHANPQDNQFTLWLGSKLAAVGYDVWADVLSLKGGQDWQRGLEKALRWHSWKMLVVETKAGVDSQGVRNEIEIAQAVIRDTGDNEFIKPLRLERCEAPFRTRHLQYISFIDGWAKGLRSVVKELEEDERRPGALARSTELTQRWEAVQLAGAQEIETRDEKLITNWIAIDQMPATIEWYKFRGGMSESKKKEAIEQLTGAVEFRNGIVGFYPEKKEAKNLQERYGLLHQSTADLQGYISDGSGARGVRAYDAKKQVSAIIRSAIEIDFKNRGLRKYLMSGGAAWWGPEDIFPEGRVKFNFGEGLKGSRALRGISEARNASWHYGVTIKPRVMPDQHIRVTSRVIFCREVGEPITSRRSMHRLRRSFCKGWRNPRWRDLLLSFLYWWSEGNRQITVRAGTEDLVVSACPKTVVAPISVTEELDAASDPGEDAEDHMDDGIDDWDWDEFEGEDEDQENVQ